MLKYFSSIFLFLSPALLSADTMDSATQYFYSENYNKAIEHYLIAHEEDSGNSEILFHIGFCYILLGKKWESFHYWNLAKKQNPKIFKGRIFKVRTRSMAPELLKGDHIIIDTSYFSYKKAKRGDIIVFSFPLNTKRTYIKKIIGLPKEKLEIINKVVYINNQKVNEPYVRFTDPLILSKDKNPRDNFGPIEIPKDCYFVMGGNRDESFDSRYWGTLSKEYILGKALIIYLSTPSESLDDAIKERAGKIIK